MPRKPVSLKLKASAITAQTRKTNFSNWCHQVDRNFRKHYTKRELRSAWRAARIADTPRHRKNRAGRILRAIARRIW